MMSAIVSCDGQLRSSVMMISDVVSDVVSDDADGHLDAIIVDNHIR